MTRQGRHSPILRDARCPRDLYFQKNIKEDKKIKIETSDQKKELKVLGQKKARAKDDNPAKSSRGAKEERMTRKDVDIIAPSQDLGGVK